MPLSDKAFKVVTRPLDKDQIKQRQGPAGMTFNYISTDVVIELLNEAFVHNWSTRIVSSAIHGDTAVVGLELSVPDADGQWIVKQQFGSCNITKGMGPGEAFKGAASDAIKKCATLLGIGLELYQDDDAASRSAPRLPQTPSRPAPSKAPSAPRAPAAPPRAPAPPAPAPRASAPPKPGNPFGNGPSTTTASVPAPPKPATPVAAPAPPRANPFASAASTAAGPNSTQISAMTNLAARKNISQPDMIALAKISDEQGSPVQTFEELTRDQAIQVIKAAQL